MNVIRKYYPQLDVKLIFSNKLSIGSLFRFKENLPTPLCSGVIYSYQCSLCNECYTGSTTRQLQCRTAEHMGKSVRTNRPLSNKPLSAIYDHAFQSGHAILKENFKIVDRHSNAYQFRVLESLYIYKTKPSLNDGLPVQLPVTHWAVFRLVVSALDWWVIIPVDIIISLVIQLCNIVLFWCDVF